jgi:molybdenum cofactor cytidylyltransferase
MKFGKVPVGGAEGAILAHSVSVGSRRLPKGRVLDSADVAAAEAAGLDTLVVARLEHGDIAEDDAAVAVAKAVCGNALTPDPPVHGRVNLRADASGLLRVDRIAAETVNGVDEAITLGTLPDYSCVAAGDIVATVKIIPFAVPAATLSATIASAPPLLSLRPFRSLRTALVQTRLPQTADKMLDKTASVTQARLHSLGAASFQERRCAHDEEALAAVIQDLGDADLILIAGASATTDRRDVVPAAVERAGGWIERLGMPVDPGNLLCLGRLGDKAVIGLPGCARSPKRNGFDWVLERIFAGLHVSSGDIAQMGVGGLLADVERPEPRMTSHARAATKVGAVVLAAGRSTRMGGENKLMADLGGRPVLAYTLDAIEAAGLEPPIVVTGHAREEVEAILGGRSAIVVHAPDYAEGLAHSLAAGVAAIPDSWDAAIIALGDMPAVDPDTFRALAHAVTPDGIAAPVYEGKRGNPVAWGRRFFPRLGAIEGDVGGKALLAEFSAEIAEVECRAGILDDIDTPDALQAARRALLDRN